MADMKLSFKKAKTNQTGSAVLTATFSLYIHTCVKLSFTQTALLMKAKLCGLVKRWYPNKMHCTS